MQCDFINANASNGLNISSQCNEKALRWDKGDTDSYYYMTGELLYPIYNTLLDCTVSKNSIGLTNDVLDQLYMSTVGALLYASECCIVTIPRNCLKFWWSSDLSNLKKQSIFSHNSWLTAGKPLSGITAENKNKDKLRYKLVIKKAKDEASSVVSDKLHETLVEKNSTCFWKSWKNKVCNNLKSKIRLEGNLSPQRAVDEFVSFFEKVTAPNSTAYDAEKKRIVQMH